MQACQEPAQVYPEKHFEDALTTVVRAVLEGRISAIVQRFGLASHYSSMTQGHELCSLKRRLLAVSAKVGSASETGRGEGPQVEILLSPPERLIMLNGQVAWAFVDATQAYGTSRYALLNCSEAKDAAMGTVARGKQNNFRISVLEAHLTEWAAFCDRLESFLLKPC